MGLNVIDGTPSSISKFIREKQNRIPEIEQNHFNNPPKCLVCKKPMTPQYDSRMKRVSGFIWRCEKCTPKGMTMLLA